MIKRFFISSVLVVLIFLTGISSSQSQETPFRNEIEAFKKSDSLSFPPKNAILFVGSSSFNYWKDVASYFPGYTIINRGFGGSSLPHVIRYAEDIIFPYEPKQVLIYCGENDFASSASVTPKDVLERFTQLYSMIRNRLPKANIAFVSIKPSPSRQNLMPKMVEANALIRKFIKKEKNAAFIDVYNLMLNADGSPKKEIFTGDNLHMNASGYAIWAEAIKPYLLK